MLNKGLFILVSVFISISAMAANVPQASSVAQGGFQRQSATAALTLPLTSLSSRVSLIAGNQSLTTSAYYAFASMNGPQGIYQVPSGKTLYCLNAQHDEQSITYYGFGYATASFTNGTTSAPTGAQCYGQSCLNLEGIAWNCGSQTSFESVPLFLSFPSNDYPFVFINGTAGNGFRVILDCVLQ